MVLALDLLCALTRHAGGCAVMNSRIGQRIIRHYLRFD